jgi:hypothetical protein
VKAAEDHTTTFTFNYKNCTLDVDDITTTGGGAITGSTNVPNVGPVALKGKILLSEGGVLSGSGTLTVTKKKADTIKFTLSKGEIDSTGEFECTITITGGTGTYEFATGTGLVEGTIGAEAKNETAKVSFLAQGVISF